LFYRNTKSLRNFGPSKAFLAAITASTRLLHERSIQLNRPRNFANAGIYFRAMEKPISGSARSEIGPKFREGCFGVYAHSQNPFKRSANTRFPQSDNFR
jgi:hypothetical protein